MLQEVVIFLKVFHILTKSFGKFQALKDAPHASIKSLRCWSYNKTDFSIHTNIFKNDLRINNPWIKKSRYFLGLKFILDC